AELLAEPHPLVAAAAAVWTASWFQPTADFRRWQAGLPAAVSSGELPSQAGLDAWAREHTFGLINRFPVDVGMETLVVLASALATKVSWQQPFQLAPASSLGAANPWARELSRVLVTPKGPGHRQFIAATPDTGDVIVHSAVAAGGLLVVSVAAQPGVESGRVLSAAQAIGHRLATGSGVEQRDLGSLPLGESQLWVMREVVASADSCTAVLPAWSASSEHDLTNPELGFAAASRALVADGGPWDAKQKAMARYSRTGFEAAAVTAMAIRAAAHIPGQRRHAELRFGHPYAVVALVQDETSRWHGLPVFSAWVSEPEDATDDEPEASAQPL
ncbi:MAG: hypothetical protein J2P27_09340, partial [Actinobacteria bacterium]|nr:hypothetical protein [Actinomycetota bacterium]